MKATYSRPTFVAKGKLGGVTAEPVPPAVGSPAANPT